MANSDSRVPYGPMPRPRGGGPNPPRRHTPSPSFATPVARRAPPPRPLDIEQQGEQAVADNLPSDLGHPLANTVVKWLFSGRNIPLHLFNKRNFIIFLVLFMFCLGLKKLWDWA